MAAVWTFPASCQPLAVVAHDAGAANLIAAALGAGQVPHRALVAGPAERIWAGAGRGAHRAATLEEALDGAHMLLTGTGWSSTLEHEARGLAKRRGLLSVAVIDHWVNYRERFNRLGEEILPDEIWLMDAYAVAEARRSLPGVALREQPNIYLRQQAGAAGARPEAGDLLFVSEPARSNWGKGVEGEFQTLDYLVQNMALAGIDPATPLRIRQHPSDPPGKYDDWIARHPGSRLDTARDMAAALQSARWVAGLQTFALVIALEAGRPAICALPPGAPPCKLPHDGLIHLCELAA